MCDGAVKQALELCYHPPSARRLLPEQARLGLSPRSSRDWTTRRWRPSRGTRHTAVTRRPPGPRSDSVVAAPGGPARARREGRPAAALTDWLFAEPAGGPLSEANWK